MPILLLLLIFVIVTGFGRALIARLPTFCTAVQDRLVYSAALGLGVLAYSVLLVGLLGHLSAATISVVLVAMAAIGFNGIRDNFRDAMAVLKALPLAFTAGNRSRVDKLLMLGGIVTVVVMLSICMIACYKPPAGAEWDAISYHLADPSQFLLQHQIWSMPTEHHSNFPFLMEMLFTIGLAYQGYVLANMFHLLTAVMLVLGVFSYTKQFISERAAWLTLILLSSTPVIVWESTVAYVEVCLAFFSTLGILAAVRAAYSTTETEKRNWIAMAGVMIGFSLGVKYLALLTFGMVLIHVFISTKSFKLTATLALIAISIASPWYLKSAIVTHNPVYPYFYRIFPRSLYWTSARASGYESEQNRFGTPHSIKQPDVFIRNLMQAPWDLLTIPRAYSNAGEYSYLTLIGGIYIAFNALLLLTRKINRQVLILAVFAGAQLVAWFVVAQVSRYLVATVPLLAITGCAGACSFIEEGKRLAGHSARAIAKLIAVIALLLPFGQFIGTVFVMVIGSGDNSIVTIPSVLELLSTDKGVEQYLKRHLDTYNVVDYVNHNTAIQDGVLLYDDTRGFYLNRQYIWANEEHSSFIPYREFTDGAQLTSWMLSHQYRYAIINMNWAPQATDAANPDPDIPRVVGNEAAAFQKWYVSAPLLPVSAPGYRWRGLVGDAIRRGLWTDVGVAEHGVILLRIGTDVTEAYPALKRHLLVGDTK